MVLPLTENFLKEFMRCSLKAFCIPGSMLGAVEMQEWVRWSFLSEIVSLMGEKSHVWLRKIRVLGKQWGKTILILRGEDFRKGRHLC